MCGSVSHELVYVDVCHRHYRPRSARVLRVLGVDERGADLRRLEVLLHQVAHVAGQHSPPDGLVCRAAHVLGHLRERRRVLKKVPVQYRRSPGHELFVAPVSTHVSGRESRNLPLVSLLFVPVEHVVPTWEWLESVWIDRVDLEAVLPKLQVFYHLTLEHVADVGARRHTESGKQLLGDTGPANEFATFQH